MVTAPVKLTNINCNLNLKISIDKNSRWYHTSIKKITIKIKYFKSPPILYKTLSITIYIYSKIE